MSEAGNGAKRVIVAGHICLDITPVFPEHAMTMGTEILMPGKLIEMKGVSVSTGGCVANTGQAMKILGADVKLMGKVGTDDFGRMILDILKRRDVDRDMILAEGESSSYSVVLAIPGTDRMFLHCPGANNTYRAGDIPEKMLLNADLLHFGYPPLMKKMYENGGRELVRLFRKAKESGCATSLDLASVDPSSDAGRADWKSILGNVIPFTDFFVPSIEELCFMLDRERFADWQERAGTKDITEILDLKTDIMPLADRCMELGCKVLLLKCGKPGLYYRTADQKTIEKIGRRSIPDPAGWADREGFERSFRPDRVLSGTGAGDTSIAAFLTAMLDGDAPEECVKLAAATGACCVSAYDALSGLKPLAELRKRIADGWEKI